MKSNDKFYALYREPEQNVDWDVGNDGLEEVVELALFSGNKAIRVHMGWEEAADLALTLSKFAESAKSRGFKRNN